MPVPQQATEVSEYKYKWIDLVILLFKDSLDWRPYNMYTYMHYSIN